MPKIKDSKGVHHIWMDKLYTNGHKGINLMTLPEAKAAIRHLLSEQVMIDRLVHKAAMLLNDALP